MTKVIVCTLEMCWNGRVSIKSNTTPLRRTRRKLSARNVVVANSIIILYIILCEIILLLLCDSNSGLYDNVYIYIYCVRINAAKVYDYYNIISPFSVFFFFFFQGLNARVRKSREEVIILFFFFLNRTDSFFSRHCDCGGGV